MIANPRQARDKAAAQRIGGHRKNDRDSLRCLPRSRHCAAYGNNNVDLEPHQLGRNVDVAFRSPFP
jgi:hypothetical protein